MPSRKVKALLSSFKQMQKWFKSALKYCKITRYPPNSRKINIIPGLHVEMPQQFSISNNFLNTQARSRPLFRTVSSSLPKHSPVTIFRASPISLWYAPTYNCHQLALYIKVPLCWDATAQHKDAVTRGRVAHLRDKVKQIAPLFDATAPEQIGFKWKLSSREYQPPWTIDQRDPSTRCSKVGALELCCILQLYALSHKVLCEDL